mmetsp:Transcript_11448/g.37864  ORF Transcript_11448/g.37864 Transcript_11448/m.37864 type:complete len:255 (-) Transcript_11448:145-909(-)
MRHRLLALRESRSGDLFDVSQVDVLERREEPGEPVLVTGDTGAGCTGDRPTAGFNRVLNVGHHDPAVRTGAVDQRDVYTSRLRHHPRLWGREDPVAGGGSRGRRSGGRGRRGRRDRCNRRSGRGGCGGRGRGRREVRELLAVPLFLDHHADYLANLHVLRPRFHQDLGHPPVLHGLQCHRGFVRFDISDDVPGFDLRARCNLPLRDGALRHRRRQRRHRDRLVRRVFRRRGEGSPAFPRRSVGRDWREPTNRGA